MDFMLIFASIAAYATVMHFARLEILPGRAYIISRVRDNRNKPPKVIIGYGYHSSIMMPFFERKDELVVAPIPIAVRAGNGTLTKDRIGVNIDATAKICLKSDNEGMQEAMAHFLNLTEAEIASMLTIPLQESIREAAGTLGLKELLDNRKTLGDEALRKAQEAIGGLGVQVMSLNIKNVETM